MKPDIQSRLENERAVLEPLKEDDFETLYHVASDEKIWEQHPNKTRWQRPVFETFFEGAMQSGGAYKIIDAVTGAVAGSTRFYDYDADEKVIKIGYTFYGTKFWGTDINATVKKMMLAHAFQFADKVHFEIGATNVRSQIAITRLGAKKIKEVEIAYYGEPDKLNFVYEITKADWLYGLK